jgi:hypothetical protein
MQGPHTIPNQIGLFNFATTLSLLILLLHLTCVYRIHEVRQTGKRARDLGMDYKLYYSGGEEKRNDSIMVLCGDIRR